VADTIFITTKVYIPARLVDQDEVSELFTHHQFDEKGCRRCKFITQRPCKHCWTCQNFKGSTRLFEKKSTSNGVYIGIPHAPWKKARKLLGLSDVPVKDLRPKIDFPQDLYWTGQLRPNQEQVVDQFWANVFDKGLMCGLIQANPRFGKTFTATNILCELGYKAIIFASELGWLEQFADAFIQSTNVGELKNAVTLVSTKPSSRPYKTKPGICVVNSVEKVPPETCVLLVAYQAFIHDFDKVLRLLHGKYTAIVVDEVDLSAAQMFSKLLNNLDVTYRIGLSATMDRNDGMSPVMRRIMGNVAAKSDAIVMQPYLHLVETGVSADTDNPTTRVTILAKSKTRNKLILKLAFQDLRANPLHCLFLPVARVSHMHKLTQMFNQQAAHDNLEARNNKQPEPWPYPLALSYSGATHDHKKVRDAAINREVRVVVSVNKKVQRGISIPAWTHVYTGLYPVADGPGWTQLFSRVCTPFTDGTEKPQPIVRHFVDGMPSSAGTLRNLYHSPYASLKEALDTGKMLIDAATKERLLHIVSRSGNYHGPQQVAMSKQKRRKQLGGFMGLSKRR
jgi:hypothetical protein